jgi:hypothetical protein
MRRHLLPFSILASLLSSPVSTDSPWVLRIQSCPQKRSVQEPILPRFFVRPASPLDRILCPWLSPASAGMSASSCPPVMVIHCSPHPGFLGSCEVFCAGLMDRCVHVFRRPDDGVTVCRWRSAWTRWRRRVGASVPGRRDGAAVAVRTCSAQMLSETRGTKKEMEVEEECTNTRQMRPNTQHSYLLVIALKRAVQEAFYSQADVASTNSMLPLFRRSIRTTGRAHKRARRGCV